MFIHRRWIAGLVEKNGCLSMEKVWLIMRKENELCAVNLTLMLNRLDFPAWATDHSARFFIRYVLHRGGPAHRSQKHAPHLSRIALVARM